MLVLLSALIKADSFVSFVRIRPTSRAADRGVSALSQARLTAPRSADGDRYDAPVQFINQVPAGARGVRADASGGARAGPGPTGQLVAQSGVGVHTDELQCQVLEP